MPLWRQLSRGLRVLFRRGQADRELDTELEHWLDQAAADLAATGLSQEEARRAARLQVGSTLAARDEERDHGWEHVIGGAGARGYR